MSPLSLRPFTWRPIAQFAAAVIALAPATLMAADFDEAERLARLPAEQRALAERFIAFNDEMSAKYFARAEALNEGLKEPTEMKSENETSVHNVKVVRGDTVEKMGRLLSQGKQASPGRGEGKLVFSRFYSIDVHAKTPLVGMLHAAIVLQFFEDGKSGVGGWLDVMPGTRVEEDLAALKKVIDDGFARYGKDPAPWRELVCKGTEETIGDFRRKPSCSGASFYGPPVFPGDTEKSIAIVMELFDAFTGAYLDSVEKRKDQAFTPADIAAQDAMRKQWLVDQLFSDPFSSKIVPFEVWSLANVPPVIKF